MKLLVVSNMYPDQYHPSYGVFVKKFCQQLQQINIDYELSVKTKSVNIMKKTANYIKFYFLTFIKYLRTDADIIYVHYASHSSLPILVGCIFKKRCIYVNVHGSDIVPENWIQKIFQPVTKAALKKSDMIIVPSDYFCNYVRHKYNIPIEKTLVYPSSGIDSKLFSFSSKLMQQEKRIGFAGRISHGKGWETYLKAIPLVLKAYPKASFYLVGDGKQSRELDKMIHELDIENNVIRSSLLPQEELAEYYKKLDLFIFPTEREGESLGLVGLEALACGTPIIASDYAAPSYYVEESYNGYKFPKGNVQALAEKIIKYLSLSEKEQEIMQKNASVSVNKYKDSELIDQLYMMFDIHCREGS